MALLCVYYIRHFFGTASSDASAAVAHYYLLLVSHISSALHILLLLLLLCLCALGLVRTCCYMRNENENHRQHTIGISCICEDHHCQKQKQQNKRTSFTLISHSIHNNVCYLQPTPAHRRKRWQFYYNRLLHIIMKSADVFDGGRRWKELRCRNAMIQNLAPATLASTAYLPDEFAAQPMINPCPTLMRAKIWQKRHQQNL